jgi:hypothetical protein
MQCDSVENRGHIVLSSDYCLFPFLNVWVFAVFLCALFLWESIPLALAVNNKKNQRKTQIGQVQMRKPKSTINHRSLNRNSIKAEV